MNEDQIDREIPEEKPEKEPVIGFGVGSFMLQPFGGPVEKPAAPAPPGSVDPDPR